MTSREKERKNTKVYRTGSGGEAFCDDFIGVGREILVFCRFVHNTTTSAGETGAGQAGTGMGSLFFLFPRQKIGRAFGVQTNFRDWVWFLLLTFSCFFVSLATNGGVGSIYIQGARGWNWYKQTLGYYFCVAITSLCLLSILFVSSSLFRNLMSLRVHLPPLFLLSSP